MTKKVCGYTGKGLRINLTTQEVKVEATFPRFKDDIGGTAIGYKVFWEEVDPKTSCYDPENKLVIAPGPLSGTGAICSGRTAITTLWPTAYPQSLISSAHVGGELAHKLKFAGWDFVIIEGESAKPIYLYINNDKVEFRDASAIWGQGTYRSASMLAQETRPDVSIGTIGPAGENGVPMSNMMVDRSHSAGGIGSIMGKKKLKALVVWGDGAVHIAASPKQWEELVDQHRSILGAHTQSIVPRNPSPLHEYYTPASRWSAYPGAVWGAANPPVTITEKAMDPHDLNHIGYRTCSSEFYLGKGMWQPKRRWIRTISTTSATAPALPSSISAKACGSTQCAAPAAMPARFAATRSFVTITRRRSMAFRKLPNKPACRSMVAGGSRSSCRI